MADTGEGGGGLDQQRLASSLDGTCSPVFCLGFFCRARHPAPFS